METHSHAHTTTHNTPYNMSSRVHTDTNYEAQRIILAHSEDLILAHCSEDSNLGSLRGLILSSRKFDRQPYVVFLTPLTPCYLKVTLRHSVSWDHTRVCQFSFSDTKLKHSNWNNFMESQTVATCGRWALLSTDKHKAQLLQTNLLPCTRLLLANLRALLAKS